jgi:hypothetical protein
MFLEKKEKISYGAFIDNFLNECIYLTRGGFSEYELTHFHLKKTTKSIPPGVYGYHPSTGIILDLDGQHIGTINNNEVFGLFQKKSLDLLEHAPTVINRIKDEVITGPPEKIEELEKRMKDHLRNKGIAIASESKGFFNKFFNRK